MERLWEKTKGGETLKNRLSGQLSTPVGPEKSEEKTVLLEYREGLESWKTSHPPRSLALQRSCLQSKSKAGRELDKAINILTSFFLIFDLLSLYPLGQTHTEAGGQVILGGYNLGVNLSAQMKTNSGLRISMDVKKE